MQVYLARKIYSHHEMHVCVYVCVRARTHVRVCPSHADKYRAAQEDKLRLTRLHGLPKDFETYFDSLVIRKFCLNFIPAGSATGDQRCRLVAQSCRVFENLYSPTALSTPSKRMSSSVILPITTSQL
jgi:hypothetical protein